MSRILDVAKRSNDILTDEVVKIFGFRCVACGAGGVVSQQGCSGVHASVLRAYQELELVRAWLAEGVPPKVVLELMAHIEELAREHEAKGEKE